MAVQSRRRARRHKTRAANRRCWLSVPTESSCANNRLLILVSPLAIGMIPTATIRTHTGYLTFARKPPGLGPAGVPASRASIPGMSPDASITTGVTSSPAATAFAAPASSGVSLVPVAATATPTSPAIAPVSPATGPAAALAVVSLLRPRPLSTDTPAPHVPPTAATMVALAAAAPPARRASSVPALGAMLPTQQQQTSSYHK